MESLREKNNIEEVKSSHVVFHFVHHRGHYRQTAELDVFTKQLYRVVKYNKQTQEGGGFMSHARLPSFRRALLATLKKN